MSTPRPWVVKVYDYPVTSGLSAGAQYKKVDIYPTHLPADETFDLTESLTEDDANFIVEAVNSHTALRAEVERLKAGNAKLHNESTDVMAECDALKDEVARLKADREVYGMRVAEAVRDRILTPPMKEWMAAHGNSATVARNLDLAALVKEVP